MTIDRAVFSAFGINIMWYGVLISLGVILGYIAAVKLAKLRNTSKNTMLDILI